MGDRCAGMLQRRDFPALSGRRALDAPLVDVQRGAAGVVAFDRGAKAVLKVEPPHLAVGDYIKARVLLQSHGPAHRLVFDRAEGIRTDRAVIEAGAPLLPLEPAGRSRLPTTSVRIFLRSVLLWLSVAETALTFVRHSAFLA